MDRKLELLHNSFCGTYIPSLQISRDLIILRARYLKRSSVSTLENVLVNIFDGLHRAADLNVDMSLVFAG
jgi:hypothetical protein